MASMFLHDPNVYNKYILQQMLPIQCSVARSRYQSKIIFDQHDNDNVKKVLNQE